MSVPRIALDGSMAYGSRVITINSIAYVMNSLSVETSTNEAADFNSDGTPNRIRKTRGARKWSGELQLATSSTARPKFGDTFTATYDSSYGSETYMLDDVPYEEDNNANSIRVIKVSGHIVLNPASYTTVM